MLERWPTELSSELVHALVEAGERTDYPAGSTIYRQGSYPRTLLVVGGLLRVYMSSPEHLLDLASAQQRPRGHLVARVSQQELADAVGSVREVVARVLRDFRVERLVATSPDSIHVLDPAGLHDQSWNPTIP